MVPIQEELTLRLTLTRRDWWRIESIEHAGAIHLIQTVGGRRFRKFLETYALQTNVTCLQ